MLSHTTTYALQLREYQSLTAAVKIHEIQIMNAEWSKAREEKKETSVVCKTLTCWEPALGQFNPFSSLRNQLNWLNM